MNTLGQPKLLIANYALPIWLGSGRFLLLTWVKSFLPGTSASPWSPFSDRAPNSNCLKHEKKTNKNWPVKYHICMIIRYTTLVRSNTTLVWSNTTLVWFDIILVRFDTILVRFNSTLVWMSTTCTIQFHTCMIRYHTSTIQYHTCMIRYHTCTYDLIPY